jgi:hypothetical protein
VCLPLLQAFSTGVMGLIKKYQLPVALARYAHVPEAVPKIIASGVTGEGRRPDPFGAKGTTAVRRR